MGIALTRGREFRRRPSRRSRRRRHQRGVRQAPLPGRDPIGQHLFAARGPDTSYPAEIVGVVANSKHRTIGEDQQAAVYESFLQRSNRGRFVHFLVSAEHGIRAAVANDVAAGAVADGPLGGRRCAARCERRSPSRSCPASSAPPCSARSAGWAWPRHGGALRDRRVLGDPPHGGNRDPHRARRIPSGRAAAGARRRRDARRRRHRPRAGHRRVRHATARHVSRRRAERRTIP